MKNYPALSDSKPPLAKVATVDDHIHFGFFGRIPHEVTFKVDGIGRGSINPKWFGPRPLDSSVHTFLSHLSVEEPFTFLGEGLLLVVKATTFLNQSVAKPKK